MHNTILLTITMMLTSVSASAQFYTITKETEISGKISYKIAETPETPVDTIFNIEQMVTKSNVCEIEENLGESILNARKSDDYESHNNDNDLVKIKIEGQSYPTLLNPQSLPELTIPNLMAEIRKNNIKFPKIVLAQAILETGWFKSAVCRNKHNLFGLTNPRTKDYYEFNHWTESVIAYYTLIQHRYNGGNYLLWLNKICYAEDNNYVRAIIKILKQLEL